MISKHSNNGKLPLVLLHGWGVNSGVWDKLFDDLSQWFDVICLDIPGFGCNQAQLPQPFDLDSLSERLAPLCPPGSIVVGWSLGGLIACNMALKFNHDIRSVCLVASSPKFLAEDDWLGIKAEVLDAFSQQLVVDIDKTVARFLAIQAMGSETARKDIAELKHAVMAHPVAAPQALSGGLDILRDSDLRLALETLKLPLRGIYGRLDTLVPLQSIERMAQRLDDFEYGVVHKASHAPFMSHKDEFIEQLLKFYRHWL